MASAFSITLDFILKVLSQRFGEIKGFNSHVKEIQKRVHAGYISSVRRAELELFQAGKVRPLRDELTQRWAS